MPLGHLVGVGRFLAAAGENRELCVGREKRAYPGDKEQNPVTTIVWLLALALTWVLVLLLGCLLLGAAAP